MAIFGKKPEWDQKSNGEGAAEVVAGATAAPIALRASGSYGIAETIQLMRTLPVDRDGDLVVRVVRATLASVNVHLPEIIEDASRKQKATQEKIAAEQAQITELEKQLEVHRKEIASLEAELKETTTVRDRLQLAEKAASASPRIPEGALSTLLGTQSAPR
jgi:hypothetical protein